MTGQTAASYDWNQMMKRSAPLVFGFVLTFAFLLLLVSFRSIVIATKAVVLNLLSVAAAYGVVVAVFQWGWGEHVLGLRARERQARRGQRAEALLRLPATAWHRGHGQVQMLANLWLVH